MMNGIYAALLFFSFTVLGVQAAPLSGTYTINPNGSGSRNVKTFNAAVQLLKDSGVNGAVVFNVADGKYVEQVEIPAIKGTSAANNITFKSASGDSSRVVVEYTTSDTNNRKYTLYLNQGKYLNFKVFDKRVKGGSLQLENGSNYINFNGCILRGSHFNNSDNLKGPWSGSINYVTFEYNIIRYGETGVNFTNAAYGDANITFKGNTIDSNVWGVYMQRKPNLIFINNKIFSQWNGLAIDYMVGKGTIMSNKIYSTNVGLALSADSDDSIKIANNMIVSKSGNALEINVLDQNISFCHNTIISTVGLAIKGDFMKSWSLRQSVFKNNIFVSKTGIVAKIIDSSSLYSNYNCYYTSANAVALWNGKKYKTLSELKFATD